MEPNNEIAKQILKEGEGNPPEIGTIVEVHYKGTFKDGTEFDSSYSRSPLSFELGTGKVIKGWELALRTMKVGEVASITCPPEYAYGAKGMSPLIPPNATLHFEIELLGYRDKQRSKAEMEYQERIATASSYKTKANLEVSAGKYSEALELYSKGFSYIEDDPIDEDDIEQSSRAVKTLKLQYYSNMSLCELKLENWAKAVECCNLALEIDSRNLKVLFRRATAKLSFGVLEEALADCKAALQIDPANKDLKKLEVKIKKRFKSEFLKQKKLFGGMFENNHK